MAESTLSHIHLFTEIVLKRISALFWFHRCVMTIKFTQIVLLCI